MNIMKFFRKFKYLKLGKFKIKFSYNKKYLNEEFKDRLNKTKTN